MKKFIFIVLCLLTVAAYGQVGAPETQLVLLNNGFYEFQKKDPDGNNTVLPTDAEVVPKGIADKIKALSLEQLNDSSLNAVGIPPKYANVILGISTNNPKAKNAKQKTK